MPGKVRNRIFIIVFTTLLLLAVLLLSSLPGSPLNFLTSPISAVLEPVQKGLIGITDQITGFYESLTEGARIRQENQSLEDENAGLRNQIAQLEEAGRQYEELKDAFKLKDQFDSYTILGARVMTREIGTWFDVFRIDLGTKDGLTVTETVSFAVVDAQSRLIGRVMSTDAVSGKVLPLLHEGFAVSAKVNIVNGSLVRVRGDLDLKGEGLCLVDQIPANAKLQVGDELVTSGVGGLFPAGIPIGKVVSISDEETKDQRRAILQPYADLENLTTVFVMKGKTTP
ncbi:MAG: rod shape-determining protein MreC [Clostridiaceae bacterium]|nr:rod shape-determining protein MreC [Clostridiaceae bacterium]